jgi:perosamine synthetase
MLGFARWLWDGTTMKYMLAAPFLSGSEWAYVQECLQTNWISSKGRFIEEFESCFAQFTQRKHAIATCNGTAALHIALAGLGAGPGDEVIVPSLTYVASVNAVAYCGAMPVFADSDPRTGCLSVDSVARLLSPRTRGIVAVHLYGHPCDMQPLLELTRARGLWLLEDAAEAHGAAYDGTPAGGFGEAAMFSFFGNKIVTTGEGGMVVTDDDQLAVRLRLLRGQGMDPQQRYWHPTLGYNYRMTNIQAAIGLGQMEHVDQLIYDRRRIADWYRERLADVPTLTLLDEVPPASSVFWLYSVLLDRAARRDPLMIELAEAGIETRPFFHPVHRFPMYQQARTDNGCPVACDLAARGINLPTSSYLRETDIDAIAGVLRELAGAPRRPQPVMAKQTQELAWQ